MGRQDSERRDREHNDPETGSCKIHICSARHAFLLLDWKHLEAGELGDLQWAQDGLGLTGVRIHTKKSKSVDVKQILSVRVKQNVQEEQNSDPAAVVLLSLNF